MLAMAGTPISALAVRSQCEVQHHSCDETAADVCCCGHVTTESQQPAPGNAVVFSVSVAAQPATSAAPSPAWSPDRHELVPYVDHLVLDRVVLFRVLLI
jgi:hypothetical protein